MNYTDFELLDPASTIPVTSGQLTFGMLIALTALILALTGVAWMWRTIRGLGPVQADERRSLRAGIAAALVAALGSAVFFIAGAVSPNQSAVSSSEQQVRQNYDQLLSNYGLESKDDLAGARVGDIIEVKRPSWDNYALAKIAVIDGEVVLTNTAGDPLPRD